MASNDIRIMLDEDSKHSPPVPASDVPASDVKHIWEGIERPFQQVRVSIKRLFDKLDVRDPIDWSIYKVPCRLRDVSEKAYEPNVISIGPYHHGKEHLKTMERIKRNCFAKIIEETNKDFREFLQAMKPLEEQVRKRYEEDSELKSDQFVEMMVYDGCFIVQLIRGIYTKERYFKLPGVQTDIRYDLLLLENQLPFSVLCKLFSMIVPRGGGDPEFARLAFSLFNNKGPGPEIWPWFESENFPSPKNHIKHLLDLVHNCCRPSPEGIRQSNDFKAKQPKHHRSWKFIRSATELKEAGIKFFAIQDQGQRLVSLFDIEFTKDTKELKIPTLLVDCNTDRILRNFMAYEQFIPSGEPRYVSDYVVFMDNLINTGEDVQLLCNKRIIDNCLGDDEAVANMFNKVRDFVYWSEEDFYYAEIFCRVNDHCKKKWNKWKATLKRDYFNSPWSVISFLAAVVLLLLTFLQTIFSAR